MGATVSKPKNRSTEVTRNFSEGEVEPIFIQFEDLGKNEKERLYLLIRKYLPPELKEAKIERIRAFNPFFDKLRPYYPSAVTFCGPEEVMDAFVKMGKRLHKMYLEAFYDERVKDYVLPRSVEEFEKKIREIFEKNEDFIDFVADHPLLANEFGFYVDGDMSVRGVFEIIKNSLVIEYYKTHPEIRYDLTNDVDEMLEDTIKQLIWMLEQEKELLKFLFKVKDFKDQILLLLYTSLFITELGNLISDRVRQRYIEYLDEKGLNKKELDPDKVFKKSIFGKKKYDQSKWVRIRKVVKEMVLRWLKEKDIEYIYVHRLDEESKPGYKLEKKIKEKNHFIEYEVEHSYIYRLDPEVMTRKGKLALTHIDNLITKKVINKDIIRLDDYIKTTKALIEKIVNGKLDPTKDFEFKPHRFYYYHSFRDKELNRRVKIENILPDDYCVCVWVARFLEQYMVYRTLYKKEKMGDYSFDLFFSYDDVRRRFFIYLGFVPRIALVIGKNKKEKRNEPIILGKLDSPIDFLEVVIRFCEMVKKYLGKEPRLPEDIYKKIEELKQSFAE